MEKLMKPAEYAHELGISRQAVYAKIKRGVLKSKNVEGKLYIVIDSSAEEHEEKSTSATSPSRATTKTITASPKDYKALLQAKDETISVLKETVVDLKESNKQISTTLRGEIDLLKDAFHEMRTLYTHQLEQKSNEAFSNTFEETKEEETIDIFTQEEEPRWIGVKKFFKFYEIEKEKKQAKLIKRMKKAYKKGDERFMMTEEKLKINKNKNYEDILH